MRTIGRFAIRFLILLFGLFALVLLWAFLSFPAEYVLRGLRWGESDVYDYQKFPARPMSASSIPFHFEQKPAEERVRALFQQNAAVDDLDAFLEKNRTQAFIVIQDDAILYEKYYNGAARDSIVTSFSVAKSFTSALIGIAVAEGHVHSIQDPITDYLPELAERDVAFTGISIRDLLMMSSGIRYFETSFLNGDDAKTYLFPDLRRLALTETEVIDQPGAYFLYNNYHPLLLGMILERATGMAVSDYLESRIWQPIGMEFDGSWSLDSEATGFEKMESGINGRAIDFAKFGRLYLNDGNWDGMQVVPAAWVAESTGPDMTLDYEAYYPESSIFTSGEGYYKYLWWGLQHGKTEYDYAALGNHGQFIYVSPHKKLIIVRHGESYGEFGTAWGWLEMFRQFAEDVDPPM